MPKLKSESITVRNAAGETVTLKSEVSVSGNGEFRARIPEELAGDTGFRACLEQARKSKPGVMLDVLQKYTYLRCNTLEPLMATLREAAQKFIEVNTTSTRVILYAMKQQVTYAVSADGKVAANGYLAGDGYRWPEDSDSRTIMREDGTSYMVGVWARAYEKITHKRGESVVIQYRDIQEKHAGDYDSAVNRLNAFNTAATIPDRGNVRGGSTTGNMARDDWTEIPYTDEAAEYFSRLLLSMCELARRMDEFFSDKDKLLLAIASGTPALLSNGKEE